MKKRHIFAIVIPVAAVVVLGGVYFAGRAKYQTHFLPGTYINGYSAADETASQMKKTLAEDARDYTLTLKERGDKTETLGADAVGLSVKDTGDVDALLKKQNANAWFLALSQKKNLKADTEYAVDDEKLTTAVQNLEAFKPENVTAPTDISIELKDNKFSIKDGDKGTTLKADETVSAVKEAVLTQKKSLDLDKAGLYESIENPAQREALQKQVDTYNSWLAATQTYSMKGKTYTADAATIAGWMKKNEDGTYDLDTTKVHDFVDKMAYDTDTFGLARDFKTHSGRTIHLSGGGDYGWAMNEDKTEEALIAAIKSGKANANAQAVYRYSAEDRGANDIGGRYVEVNISQQKMWCYNNGQPVVETDVVTGNEARGMATPSGSVWAIDAKKSPDHFKSTNVDVTYWMPFNGGCGIHDASWRSTFGGSIYKTNGSHGCVNTPLAAVQQIYSIMKIGDPVVVYYSEDQPVGPQPTGEVTGG